MDHIEKTTPLLLKSICVISDEYTNNLELGNHGPASFSPELTPIDNEELKFSVLSWPVMLHLFMLPASVPFHNNENNILEKADW
jgi:hypothetical protein